jgi:hypothetical protein
MQSIPRDHASHAAVRGLELPTPLLRPFALSDTTPLYSTASRALRGRVFLARAREVAKATQARLMRSSRR